MVVVPGRTVWHVVVALCVLVCGVVLVSVSLDEVGGHRNGDDEAS